MKKRLFLVFCFVIGQQILYAQKIEKMSQCTVRVGVYDNSPKIFMSEQSEPQGIFIDVIQEVAHSLNWHISYVYGNWYELEHMLQNGSIDMLPDVAYSEYRDSLYVFNAIPILESWLEVFVLKPYKITSLVDLHTKKIAVLQGSIQEQFIQPFLKKIGVDVEIVPFPTYESSVCALQDGTVDVLLASRFFYFSDLYNPSILSTSHVFNPTQLHVAFRRGFDKALITDFDAELLLLMNDGKSVYYDSLHRWLQREYVPSIPNYIWYIIIVLGVGIVLFLLFVIILRKRVAQKTHSLQQLNLELVSAKQKVEESNTLKSMFLQNMSHEIRTPMNGILGFVDLLRESDITPEEKETYISIIEKSAQRLLALIDEILEMSKIKAGQMQVFQSRITVQKLMQFVYDLYYSQICSKDIVFTIQESALSDTTEISTDVLKLETILLCLMSNALKFTHQGTIECGCFYTETTIVFFVKDTGIGVDAEQSESIFEMFVQGQNSIDSEYDGAGLGLAIAKAYAILLGGTVWFESEVGNGSTFYVSLPYSQNK